jgi:hypothetical protein
MGIEEQIQVGVRLTLGFFMLIAGTNEWFHYVQIPYEGEAAIFMGLLQTAGGGYLMKIVGSVQIIAAISFFTNRFVPLGALMLFPVMFNALLFHLFLDFGGTAGAAVCSLLNILLLVLNYEYYENLLYPSSPVLEKEASVISSIRIILGIGLLIVGFDKFFEYFQPFHQQGGDAAAVFEAVASAGYIIHTIGVLQLLGGLSFISKKFTPLMVLVLSPVLLNDMLFHAIMDINGILIPLILVLLNSILLLAYKTVYRNLIRP